MSDTYRIDDMGGPMARWLSSIDEAKRRFLAAVKEGADFDRGTPSEVTFETSTEGEMGEPRPEYVRCLVDGKWDANISPERPAWPTHEPRHGKSPDLVMAATSCKVSCSHVTLTCRNEDDPAAGRQPRIECADCGQTWDPAP